MRTLIAASVAALITVGSIPANAQSIGIGSNQQGSLAYAIASGVASAVSKNTKLTARPVGFGGSTAFMPRIDAGLLEFGANNLVDTVFAQRGVVTFKKAHPNVRVIARLVPLQVGILVHNDSDITKLEQLKGRPFPTEWSRQKIALATTGGMIALAGLKWSDFKPVPVANFGRGVQMLVEGKVVATNAAPGSGTVREANSKIPMRFLSLPVTPESRRILQQHLPGAEFVLVKPQKRLPAVRAPVNLISYPYLLVAGAHVKEDTVYQVTKALYGAKKDLVASHGIFRAFSPKKMAIDTAGVPYHPGAIRFYREAGMWPPK